MGGDLAPLEITKQGPFGPLVPDASQPEVIVQGIADRMGDVLVVSLFLVNQQDEPEELRDEAWLFQPEISVQGLDGEAPFLGRARGVPTEGLPEDESRANAMLYRDRVEFAVGHGTSVTVDVAPGDSRHAVHLRTKTVPRFELAQQDPRSPPAGGEPASPAEDPALAGFVLDMKELAETERSDLPAKLSPS
jgi:hypothetical protein